MATEKIYVSEDGFDYELRVFKNQNNIVILHLEDVTRVGSDIVSFGLSREDVVSLIGDLNKLLKEIR